jgi:hypothetical protein
MSLLRRAIILASRRLPPVGGGGSSSSTRAVSPVLSALVTTAKRTKVTWTGAKPSIADLEHVGDHGTTSAAVSSMQAEGIKPAKTGSNFAGGSQGGPGLYLSDHPSAAAFFAANASHDNPALLAQLVSFYRKKGAGKRAPVPSSAFYNPPALRAIHGENASTHELDLGSTKLPPEIRGSSSGSTTLLTQHAIDDPHVEYFAVPHAPMPRTASEALMAKLSPEWAKQFAAWRNGGRKPPTN